MFYRLKSVDLAGYSVDLHIHIQEFEMKFCKNESLQNYTDLTEFHKVWKHIFP